MSYRADPNFLLELKEYGNINIESCFNCGNCTAVCPLASDDVTFPRRIIRFAQLGLVDRLLSSRELWMCYYCGECTQTCPRQADPGEFMAATRRYAIARYDRLGIARYLIEGLYHEGLGFDRRAIPPPTEFEVAPVHTEFLVGDAVFTNRLHDMSGSLHISETLQRYSQMPL